jgi:hypothetical protein
MRSFDLEYDEGSLLHSVNLARVLDFQRWLAWFNETLIEFDAAYIRHLSQFHGGVPAIGCFQTAAGHGRRITRFLNFQADGESQLEYSVDVTLSMIAGDRLGPRLVPFAELFAGDYLCFDFGRGGRPSIVVWLHEFSNDDAGPVTDFVAHNYDEFISGLTRCS